MKTMMLLVAVLVAGCGNPVEYNTLCDTTLVRKLGGESDRLDCGRLWHNLDLAKKYMMKEYPQADGTVFQPIRNEEEWNYYFSDVAIHVSAEDAIPDPMGGEELWGYYDGINLEVQLESDERALMHELFHRIDTMNLRIDTMTHTGWGTNGYTQAIGWYEASRKKPAGKK